MGFLLIIFMLTLGWAHGFNKEFLCTRLRGQCVLESECRGKTMEKLPCNEQTHKCCIQRRRSDQVQTKPPTEATTLKPAIKATRLPVVNCGRTKYSSDDDLDKRIVGGHEAKKGQWPWLVSLRDNGVHQCGGSIINRQWILTAAHCFKRTRNPSRWTVVAGEHDASVSEGHEVVAGVDRVFVHENYDNLAKTNDVALMLLDEPLPDEDADEDEEWINEICLPDARDVVPVGDVCNLMGWGYLSNAGPASDILQQVSVPILDLKLCAAKYNKTYEGVRSYQPYLIDQSQLCAGNLEGGKDSCQGDSGGPLTCRRADGTYYVAGLTSYSIGCGYERTPGVYTKTTSHLNWIKGVMEANTEA